MLIADIDHVQLAGPAGCEDEARRFFTGLLGLPELTRPAELNNQGGCWFQVGLPGGRQVHIGIEPNFRPALKAHPAFATSQIEAVAKSLETAGVACKWDNTIPGLRRFFANDPWGNRLEFTEK